MKKYILSVLLGTTICATGPVFAMLQDVEFQSTGIPVRFEKIANGYEITTDDNNWASYQATSKKFNVKSGDKLHVEGVVDVNGIMALGWLNSAGDGWYVGQNGSGGYEDEVVFKTGNHAVSFDRTVPAGETEATLVSRNYHLGTSGQTTFTLKKIQMSIDPAAISLTSKTKNSSSSSSEDETTKNAKALITAQTEATQCIAKVRNAIKGAQTDADAIVRAATAERSVVWQILEAASTSKKEDESALNAETGKVTNAQLTVKAELSKFSKEEEDAVQLALQKIKAEELKIASATDTATIEIIKQAIADAQREVLTAVETAKNAKLLAEDTAKKAIEAATLAIAGLKNATAKPAAATPDKSTTGRGRGGPRGRGNPRGGHGSSPAKTDIN